MIKDPIVAEVRRTRAALYKKCGYDLKKLARFLEGRRKQRDPKPQTKKARSI